MLPAHCELTLSTDLVINFVGTVAMANIVSVGVRFSIDDNDGDDQLTNVGSAIVVTMVAAALFPLRLDAVGSISSSSAGLNFRFFGCKRG